MIYKPDNDDLSDEALLKRTFEHFEIDPDEPYARQRLARELWRMIRAQAQRQELEK
jgi:hypothetical protein